MTFVIGGFDEDEPYGKVFILEIPNKPEPEERNPDSTQFGITYGGQSEFVNRLIMGLDPSLIDYLNSNDFMTPELEAFLTNIQMNIPLTAMPLQNCVDLAIFFIRTTINAQKLSVGIRGCGGPIDVAIITRSKGLEFVQQKQINGEKEF